MNLFNSPVQKFLATTLFENEFVYFDYWSIIHFCSGLVLGFLFARYWKKNHGWLAALSLLIIYEIFESSLDYIVFIPENKSDTIWDVVIGMIGFFITYLLLLKNKKTGTNTTVPDSDQRTS